MSDVVSEFAPGQLVDMISSVTDISVEELDSVRDVPEFARRLVNIALDGTVTNGEVFTPSGVVLFSTDLDSNSIDETSASFFGHTDKRIVAHYILDNYDLDSVMVKWSKVYPPDILSLRRQHVARAEDFSRVWFEREDGWGKGQYRVGIYSADERMTLLAESEYRVF